MRKTVALLLVLTGPAAAQEAWLPRGTADLVVLDKVRGQPTDMAVKVGESGSFGSLAVAVRSCVVRPPDQPADAAAFVDVTDQRTGIFHGWLLSNTPAVSQMENPVYGLRLIGCR